MELDLSGTRFDSTFVYVQNILAFCRNHNNSDKNIVDKRWVDATHKTYISIDIIANEYVLLTCGI